MVIDSVEKFNELDEIDQIASLAVLRRFEQKTRDLGKCEQSISKFTQEKKMLMHDISECLEYARRNEFDFEKIIDQEKEYREAINLGSNGYLMRSGSMLKDDEWGEEKNE